MLDNLKLGYGGTKEEMKRLLADAEALKAANGEMVSYSIDSFADMVEAIHVVQTEMGITGTTALEASTTIEGSIASMNASWANLMVGIADENADINELAQNFASSVDTAAGNIIYRFQQIVGRIGEGTVSVISSLRKTNDTVDRLVTSLEYLAAAAGAASVAIASIEATKKVKGVADVFGCYVQTNYSCTEGGTIACECTEKHFHINDDWVIIEAVDEHNQPVPFGTQSAKLLLTNLANRICPIIRFEITDRIVLHNEPCSCGDFRPWLTLEGRTDDVLIFRNGVRIAPLSLYAVLKEVQGVERFQLVQHEQDRLELRLVAVDREKTFFEAKQAVEKPRQCLWN